jgi:phosphoglycolate phosphatase-like HAD superfamily hydrolase
MNTVVFDFDGTIADTFGVGLDIFYNLTGRGQIPKGELDRLRGMSFIMAVRALKIPFWKAPLLLSKGRKELARRMNEIEPFYGVDGAIRELKKDGYELHIISLNSAPNIHKFLREHNLDECFSSVHGKARLWGKTRTVRRLMRAHKLTPKDIVYVGDETRDVEAARRADVRAIAVTWGYNNLHILEQSKPEAMVFDASELPTTVQEIIG